MKDNFKSRFKKTMRKIFLGIIVVAFITFSFMYWGVYSRGYRSGVIIKFSERGVVFKTNEGQLNLGTFAIADPKSQFSQIWDFSVEDSETQVLERLRRASLTGERVELQYIQRYMKFPWRGDTDYFIYEVIMK